MSSAVAYAAPSQMDELAFMGSTAPESLVYWPTVRCPVTGLRVKRPQWTDGTRPAWRLELKNGRGVYSAVTISWDKKRHPMPEFDLVGNSSVWSYNDFARFGFPSYDALIAWCDERFLAEIYSQRYADDKVGLALYRAHITAESARQCVFDIRGAERLVFAPLTVLEFSSLATLTGLKGNY